jgi:excisionase family DNA binding protein
MDAKEAIEIIDAVTAILDPDKKEEFLETMRERYCEATEDVGDAALTSVMDPGATELFLNYNPEPFKITSSRAARILGVSLVSVRRWADNGDLNHIRTPGGQRRFSIEDLKDFVVNQSRNS